ncbi:hypothetical protein [Curtobacterium sp. ZW137]|uniref:hypothetical protein n=1 Tax=Curtobacterium sp. ZW137 TaxID=2485104 RepID=UPI000F4C9B02|nr:hypothetical protein [Curtobacterium sp. ZW137]ROP63829.1 hypothetical protein EDF55_2593 [Curtobacterium sp. ZW137]
MRSIRTSTIATAAGLLLTAVALTGCSAAGPAPTEQSSASSGTDDQQRSKWFADVDKCFSDAGFDPDDESLQQPGAPQAAKDAWTKCSEDAGEMPGVLDENDPAVKAASAAMGAALDKCFRSLGYTVPPSDVPGSQMPEGITDDEFNKCSEKSSDVFDDTLRENGIDRKKD